MEEFGVVPDVIDVVPENNIKILFDSGVSVEQGNILTPTQVKNQPDVYWDANPKKYYTLVFCDPDAPSRANPELGQIRHWTVVNIPGDDISKGDTLFEYVGSGPPQGSGLHRYVYLIHEQVDGIIDFSDEPRASKTTRTNRPKFSARDFAKKYNLGNPIAANFYQAEYDDYVPILHAQYVSK